MRFNYATKELNPDDEIYIFSSLFFVIEKIKCKDIHKSKLFEYFADPNEDIFSLEPDTYKIVSKYGSALKQYDNFQDNFDYVLDYNMEALPLTSKAFSLGITDKLDVVLDLIKDDIQYFERYMKEVESYLE